METEKEYIDLERFSGVLRAAYVTLERNGELPQGWELKDYQQFFEMFFQLFEHYEGHPHWPISKATLMSCLILLAEPITDPNNPEVSIRLLPAEYDEDLLRGFFEMPLRNVKCRTVVLFLKGPIRRVLLKHNRMM